MKLRETSNKRFALGKPITFADTLAPIDLDAPIAVSSAQFRKMIILLKLASLT